MGNWVVDDPKIGFVGAGTLGNGLALALAGRGYRVAAVASRNRASADDLSERLPGCGALPLAQDVADTCDLVFLTTPDNAIKQVVSQVRWRHGQGVVHCSGAESLDVLEPAARLGAAIGSFHPYQTFACLDTPGEAVERLRGAAFCVEGRGWLLGFLERLTSGLGGWAIHVRPEDRALYHASAVMSCGYLVTLLKAVTDVWEAMGVGQDEGLRIALPLVTSTLANVSKAGAEAAVTGPVVRGDTDTVRRHLEALKARLPHLVPLYRSLAGASLPLASDRVSEAGLQAMERVVRDQT